MYSLSARSLKKLKDVHPDLIRVCVLALSYSDLDFGITEGMRTAERQERLVVEGKSWTFHSKHLSGRAVDVVAYVNGSVTWEFSCYKDIANAFYRAAKELGVSIEWGGEWKQKDGVHFQLD